jgi:hypothetical protein
LRRTPVGGDGTVETVVDDPTVRGPFAVDDNAFYLVRGNTIARRLRSTGLEIKSLIPSITAIRDIVADPMHAYVIAKGGPGGETSGLYRIALNAFSGSWELQAKGMDPHAMVQVGTSIYFTDSYGAPSVAHYNTVTQMTTAAVPPMLGTLGSITTDGSSIYFTRYGLASARTWTGEVYRLGADGAAPTLIASSITHASDAFVRGGRVVVAEHGETRASTNTGHIRAFTIR